MESFQRRGENGASNLCNSPCSSEKVNVQVILRCRPLNEEEEVLGIPAAIYCNELRGEVVAVQHIGNKLIDRTFVFDKVFGPTSKQIDIFSESISPVINEVLKGFNATIFAYGQAGTGKTYTMEGAGYATKDSAGVIPRIIVQIFQSLEGLGREHSINVSFLEIHNEEIIDLLASDQCEFSDEAFRRPLPLMEDGKGGVFARGLEEEAVHSVDEMFRILDRSLARRRTAETLMNKQSSRSHSVFSMAVQIKEHSEGGEEMIRSSRLNLVDLAGSVNVLRSGAVEGRAREAGEINKSLLTFGRVINALVEESTHVPYRDSKLTRLLRDSLGGRSKTCIIATISPSIRCFEETMSTLEYASRARSIKNKPEINLRIVKPVMMKDLCFEIDRLKKDLQASREKNGVYVPKHLFHQEDEKKAMAEKMELLQAQLESKHNKLNMLQEFHDSQQHLSEELTQKLNNCQNKLRGIEKAISNQEEQYQRVKHTMKEKECLIKKLLHSEKALIDHTNCLQSELVFADADISDLTSKSEQKEDIEERGQIIVHRFQSQLNQKLHNLHELVAASVNRQENQFKEIEQNMRSFLSMKSLATKELQRLANEMDALYGGGISVMDGLAGELDQNSQLILGKLYSQFLTNSSSLQDCFKRMTMEADYLHEKLQSNLSIQTLKLNEFVLMQQEEHSRTIEAMCSISDTVTSYFNALEALISNLDTILEEKKSSQLQQLSELEMKFEKCSDIEEKQLIEKVIKMVTISNARKKKMGQTAVGIIRESAASRAFDLQKEISMTQKLTSLTKEQWRLYIEKVENHYIEDSNAMESSRFCLEDGYKDCLQMAKMDSLLWENAEDCFQSLGRTTMTSMESIVRNGIEANHLLRANLSSMATTSLEDCDALSKGLHSSINYSLMLSHDACENINGIIIPSLEELCDLKSEHYHKTNEITDCAQECLEYEYGR